MWLINQFSIGNGSWNKKKLLYYETFGQFFLPDLNQNSPFVQTMRITFIAYYTLITEFYCHGFFAKKFVKLMEENLRSTEFLIFPYCVLGHLGWHHFDSRAKMVWVQSLPSGMTEINACNVFDSRPKMVILSQLKWPLFGCQVSLEFFAKMDK